MPVLHAAWALLLRVKLPGIIKLYKVLPPRAGIKFLKMITKKRKEANAKVDQNKAYSLKEASALVKNINTTKFDSSVDLHIRLGCGSEKSRPGSTWYGFASTWNRKTKKVLVLCTPDKEEAARNAGADFVGLDEFITKIEGGWTDVDVIIATPSVMPKIGRL